MPFFYRARGLGTLGKAARLLELKPSEDDDSLIAGCVTVMVAAALDQGTNGILEFLERAPPDNLDAEAVQRLRTASLRRRVVELPQVLSRYSLQLARSHPQVQRLHNLIGWRNRLVHPSEEFVDLDLLQEPDGAVTLAVGTLEPDQDPWDALRLKEAEAFHGAVSAYFAEVINADRILDDDWAPGALLSAATRH